eukprot:6177783-Pleurochrysis_carterae.AAC.2
MLAFNTLEANDSQDSFPALAKGRNFPGQTSTNQAEIISESFQDAMDQKPYGAMLRAITSMRSPSCFNLQQYVVSNASPSACSSAHSSSADLSIFHTESIAIANGLSIGCQWAGALICLNATNHFHLQV